jgi:hypothetical protein
MKSASTAVGEAVKQYHITPVIAGASGAHSTLAFNTSLLADTAQDLQTQTQQTTGDWTLYTRCMLRPLTKFLKVESRQNMVCGSPASKCAALNTSQA